MPPDDALLNQIIEGMGNGPLDQVAALDERLFAFTVLAGLVESCSYRATDDLLELLVQ